LLLESERARRIAGTLVPAKAARRLAQKGFSDETIELVCGMPDTEWGE
jgi:SOS response regulatory protein OraA/RecX